MEAKFKGECIELAIDCLLTMEECCADAVSWLEKSKAFVPDESKTVQELRAAMIESLQREEALIMPVQKALAYLTVSEIRKIVFGEE